MDTNRMTREDKVALYAIVNDALTSLDSDAVARIIQAAHNGRPSRFITTANQHLFRRFRNNVSGEALDLIACARNSLREPAMRDTTQVIEVTSLGVPPGQVVCVHVRVYANESARADYNPAVHVCVTEEEWAKINRRVREGFRMAKLGKASERTVEVV